MKQFSLEEYLKNPSRRVVTRDGRKVRILCTDAKINSTHTILTLVEEPNGSESIVPYPDGGQFYADKPTKADIFFAPEKHEGWANVYRIPHTEQTTLGFTFSSQEEAEKVGKSNSKGEYIATIKIEWEE